MTIKETIRLTWITCEVASMAPLACLVLVLSLQLQQSCSYIKSDVFNDKYDTFIRNGDLNIGLVTHMSREEECSGGHFAMSFLEVEALSYAVKVVNGRQDLLPNISLGMAVMDGCGDPYAGGPMLARMLYFLEDNQGSGWTKDLQQTNWPPSLDNFSPMNYPVKGVTGIWTMQCSSRQRGGFHGSLWCASYLDLRHV